MARLIDPVGNEYQIALEETLWVSENLDSSIRKLYYFE
jgi:hypothetical protein